MPSFAPVETAVDLCGVLFFVQPKKTNTTSSATGNTINTFFFILKSPLFFDQLGNPILRALHHQLKKPIQKSSRHRTEGRARRGAENVALLPCFMTPTIFSLNPKKT
jgi:hypothetical protein